MIQGRINSLLGLTPDWFYFRFTPHGRQLQSYLDLVHGFTQKVINANFLTLKTNLFKTVFFISIKVMNARKVQFEREISEVEVDELSSGTSAYAILISS